MDVVVTTGTARLPKLQSNCHHQQINTHLFTGQIPFLSPTNSVRALKGISVSNIYLNYRLHMLVPKHLTTEHSLKTNMSRYRTPHISFFSLYPKLGCLQNSNFFLHKFSIRIVINGQHLQIGWLDG